MSKRLFLLPLSVSVAVLLSGSPEASVSKSDLELFKDRIATTSLTKSSIKGVPFVIERSDSESIDTAGHRSHMSHRSHSSHRSHYSSRY
jgi:hypothetical protein